MFGRKALHAAIAPALAFAIGGCGSVVNTGAGEIAGVAGAAVAGAVTGNPGVAAGIGLGAQAGSRAGVQYWQREVHRASQERIAAAAGPLKVGQVATWQTEHKAPRSAFYVAMLCRDGAQWRWASAEPSTQRWSGLQ